MVVVRVVKDLFFSSRISEICRTLQIESMAAKNSARLEELLTLHPDALVLVDLGFPDGIGPELAGQAVQKIGAERVWAFFSHVDTELLDAAERLGATRIAPRSQFFEELPDLLTPFRRSETAN